MCDILESFHLDNKIQICDILMDKADSINVEGLGRTSSRIISPCYFEDNMFITTKSGCLTIGKHTSNIKDQQHMLDVLKMNEKNTP